MAVKMRFYLLETPTPQS